MIYIATTCDFTFEVSDYGDMKKYSDADAIALSIRNILLSKPGVYPETPSLGMNIQKYQFSLLDDQTINDIKNELYSQIAMYVPSIDGVDINIDRIEDEEKVYLGISIKAFTSGDETTFNFLITTHLDDINIYNDIF